MLPALFFFLTMRERCCWNYEDTKCTKGGKDYLLRCFAASRFS